jgi:hypothetical protein
MIYAGQWKLLSGRIRGLMQVAHFHASLAIRNSDSFGRGKYLGRHCGQIRDALTSFRDGNRQSLPPAALTALNEFIDDISGLLKDTSSTADLKEELVQAALLKLNAFEGQMTFLLADEQEAIRARVDLAFEHLQRSIVVDADMRAKWSEAFGKDEVACERLGAVHLLLHGIWAFKVSAAGERTDLVYQEPIVDFENLLRSANGLVLTEWKRAVKSDEAARRFAEAKGQAQRYAQGALAGIELTGYRYAVVVSEDHIDLPANEREGEVEYRYRNIAATAAAVTAAGDGKMSASEP